MPILLGFEINIPEREKIKAYEKSIWDGTSLIENNAQLLPKSFLYLLLYQSILFFA